jgi:hypothetical protein
MDRMLVVVFDTETKAYEGKKTLLQLENEGSIVVYAYAVIAKDVKKASLAFLGGPRVSRSAQLWDSLSAAQRI